MLNISVNHIAVTSVHLRAAVGAKFKHLCIIISIFVRLVVQTP